MRKKITIALLGSVFLVWLFTDNSERDTLDKPIRKVTETRALQLFGKRNFWVFDKSEKEYAKGGQLISTSYYNGDICDSKYTYDYTDFDSLKTATWLTGENLTAQQIDKRLYDSLHRLRSKLVYTITNAAIQPDTFLEERTTYLYNFNNKIISSSNKTYNKQDSTTTTATFTYKYNNKGSLLTKSYTFRSLYIPLKTTLTHYTYDLQGHIKAKLEDEGDSIYYVRDSKGRVVEETKRTHPFTYIDRNWYDDRGNNIKCSLDIDGGRVYEYVYDKHDRLVKEYHPGSFLFILKPCTTYEYKYY